VAATGEGWKDARAADGRPRAECPPERSLDRAPEQQFLGGTDEEDGDDREREKDRRVQPRPRERAAQVVDAGPGNQVEYALPDRHERDAPEHARGEFPPRGTRYGDAVGQHHEVAKPRGRVAEFRRNRQGDDGRPGRGTGPSGGETHEHCQREEPAHQRAHDAHPDC